ncbi:MAG: hypothetical protein HOH57_07715 [Chloroflexi bacterium]|nr:hypothetical protein [Chloroflexota bacterium]MBT5893666.1 hypothetical protein [Chloroflexota bacterium]
MLGSVIPRRVVLSFALVGLVGLVGLMMASSPTPVSADSDGWNLKVAPGSVTSLTPGSISSGSDDASSSSAEATYEWSVTGSCGSFDSTSAQNVMFTAADGTCSGKLSLSVSRAGSATVNSSVTLDVLGSGVAAVVVDTGLPATGDYSPNAMTLLLAMLAGFALLGTGVVAARRAR